VGCLFGVVNINVELGNKLYAKPSRRSSVRRAGQAEKWHGEEFGDARYGVGYVRIAEHIKVQSAVRLLRTFVSMAQRSKHNDFIPRRTLM
jgi:hypothetical protein